MSAQDDVIAAFGEMPRWRGEAAQYATPEEQAADTEAEAGGSSAGDQEAEAGGSDAGDQETDSGSGEASPEQTDQAPVVDQAVPAQQQASGADGSSGESAGPGQAEATREQAAGEAAPSIQPPQPAAAALTPNQPYLNPAAFFAQLQAEAAPEPKRRWPRRLLLLRYASALVVAGAVGAGTAYAVSLPQRTDVPFLATPSDGRYAFPAMLRPAPPAGEPAPGDDADVAQIHYGDLRQYLVPAPIGATAVEDRWEPVADFESSLADSDVSGRLYDAGLRHVARRSWTMRDGQRTVIELLQFPDHEAAFEVQGVLDSAAPAKATRAQSVVPQLTVPSFGDATFAVAMRKFDEVDGEPKHEERRVVFGTGDVVAIVTTTAPAGVADTPTRQIVLLQAQMLR